MSFDADHVRLALFFEGHFASGVVRLWSGAQPRQWDGKSWAAAGALLGVSEIASTDSVEAVGVSVSLSGVDPAVVSLALADARQGLPGRVWLAVLDDAGEVTAAREMFQGRLDVPSKYDDAETATITISYESRLIDLNRARSFRWTKETQRLFHPGDRGFDQVSAIQDIEIVWGGVRAQPESETGTNTGGLGITLPGNFGGG